MKPTEEQLQRIRKIFQFELNCLEDSYDVLDESFFKEAEEINNIYGMIMEQFGEKPRKDLLL